MIERDNNNRANPESLKRAYDEGISTPPNAKQSIFDHFTSSLFSESLATNDIEHMLFNVPKNEGLQQAYDYASLDLDNPNITFKQKLFRFPGNFLADMLGYTLGGPVGFLSGVTGGVAGRAIEKVGSAVVGESLPTFIRPIGKMIAKGNTAGLEASGFMLPQSVLDSYNQNKNDLDFKGLAQSYSNNYGVGFLLGNLGYLAGIIWNKAKKTEESISVPETEKIKPVDEIKKLEKETGLILNDSMNDITPLPFHQDKKDALNILNDAVQNNRISQEEHGWYKKFLFEPEDESLTKEATRLLLKMGHPVDAATDKINFQLQNENMIKNLNAVVTDEITHDLPLNHKSALHQYVFNSSLEEKRNSPIKKETLHGLKGFVDFAYKKILNQKKRLSQLDKYLDENLLKKIRNNHALSQLKIYSEILKSKFNKFVINTYKHTIPTNLLRAARNKVTNIKLLSPKQELIYLRNFFLKKGNLPRNFQLTNEYRRLEDISDIWPGAKDLLNRIHLQHEFEKQKSFRNVVESIRQILKSDIENLSNPQEVKDYLKYRVEQKAPALKLDEESPDITLKKSQIPDNEKEYMIEELKRSINVKPKEEAKVNINESSLEENKEARNNRPAPSLSDDSELKKETNQSVERYEEFKERQSVFSNFIKCLIGASNG